MSSRTATIRRYGAGHLTLGPWYIFVTANEKENQGVVRSSWYTNTMPNNRSCFYAKPKAFIHYGTTGFASAGFGVPFCITVSCVALFPFNAGRSKASLLPPLIPFHRPKSCPSFAVQVSAPTHGCTFHPNSKVTFACEANLPVTSVI